MNYARKNNSMIWEMRHFHGRFTSVMDARVRILEEFEDVVPPNRASFSVGSFSGKQSTKYWLCTRDDLIAMYGNLKRMFIFGVMGKVMWIMLIHEHRSARK